MNTEFRLHYSNGYDPIDGPMLTQIDSLFFRNKEQLLEYINCMCIATNGNRFVLHSTFPFSVVTYKSNFWSTKWILADEQRISSYHDLEKMESPGPGFRRQISGSIDAKEKFKRWPQFLNDIKAMPEGIFVSAKLEEKSVPSYSRPDNWSFYVKDVHITFGISDEYAQRVNNERVRFAKHQNVFEELYKHMSTYNYKGKTDIDIARNGVHFFNSSSFQYGLTDYFSKFQLKPLANKFECFVFANVLHDYIVEKEKKNLVFYDGSIELAHNVAISVIGSEPTYVRLTICFSEKNEKASLNSW